MRSRNVCWCLFVAKESKELAPGSEVSDLDRAFAVTPICLHQSTEDDSDTSLLDLLSFSETFR
jgi:hypothetical protein